MSLHLVTGYKGSAHVTSADQGAFNASLVGLKDYVCSTGKQLEAQIMSNNSIRIYDGDLLMQGRHVNLKVDTYEDLTIENGTQGTNRNDLIICRYSMDATGGQETATFDVIKGTETTGAARDPEITSGDILGGAINHEMPLYRVKIEGISIVKIEKLFSLVTPLGDVVEGVNTNKKSLESLTKDVKEAKKSVSDGKGLIAAAITLKKIATAATDTFAQMAENISKIVLGSGNAAKADVLAGKTFTNDDGVEYTGTMVDKSGTTQSATASLDTTNSRMQMTIPATGKYSTTSKVYAAYSTIRTLIGLTADKLWPGVTILGLKSSKTSMAGGTYTPTTAPIQIYCGGKAMESDIVINPMPTAVWTGWKQICKYENVATSQDSTPVDGDEYDLGADFSKYNTFIFRVVYTTGTSAGTVGTYTHQDTFICSRKADDTSSHSLTPNKTSNESDEAVYRDLEYSVGIASDNRTVEVFIYYDGESETVVRYGWFEVVLIAALAL